MKHLQFLATLLIAGTVFTACGSDDKKKDEPKPVEETKSQSFQGVFSVQNSDGSTYTQEDVVVDYTISDDKGLVLTFNQVSFSAKMPVKIDMEIPNVEYQNEDGKITLSGNNIVPFAMGGEFPKYIITNLSGTVNDGTLSISMNCGESPTTFVGSKK